MKIVIFAAFIALGLAAHFEVKDKDVICAMEDIEGTVEIEAFKDGKSAANESFTFDKATLSPDSTCTSIRIALNKTAEVHFNFDAPKDVWTVTPACKFNPSSVFGKEFPNDTVAFNAEPLSDTFMKNQSYVCHSAVQYTFSQNDEDAANYTYTVSATFKGVQAQSSNIKDGKYSTSIVECARDPHPSPSTTTPSPSPPSPGPKVENYTCQADKVTTLRIVGAFDFQITYLAEEGSKKVNKTVMVPVPEKSTLKESCEMNSTVQYMTIEFYDGWALTFNFTKSKDEYSVANITVVYVYDSFLPNSSKTGNETVVFDGSKLNLKASTKGYYTCNANSSYTVSGGSLTMYSESFRFRAFDDKGDGFNGDVTQCSADEDSNSIVPIAVGAALAGLVVIVLVAYLIGRKRSRKSGYESV